MKRKVVPDNQTLRRYQSLDVKQVVKQRRTLLAHECGLGKTAIAVVAANIWENPAVLVVAPACLLENWKIEWRRWDTLSRPTFTFFPTALTPYAEQPVVFVSYNNLGKLLKTKILQRLLAKANRLKPSLLIADEAHAVKKWTSQRGNLFHNVTVPLFHRLILITGTPVTNKIEDLHPLVSTCAPEAFPDFETFRKTYSHARVNYRGDVEYYGIKNAKKLRAKLDYFMIRRFKKNVLKELPPKIYVTHKVTIDEKTAARSLDFLDVAERMINEEQNTASLSAYDDEHTAEQFHQTRIALGLAKVPSAIEYITTLLEGGSKPLVLFAYHRQVCEELRDALAKKKYKALLIYGGTRPTKKQLAIEDFQSNKLDVLVLSISAASVGITLTAANTLVFAEQSYKADDILQAEDRIHRITQTRGVVIHTILAKASIDIRVNQLLNAKLHVQSEVVGDEASA